jgi:hypothetical protein
MTTADQDQSASLEALLDALRREDDPRRLAMIAEALQAAGDRRAIAGLLGRLGDRCVQGSPSAEDALCAALTAFDVMWTTRSGLYGFVPKQRLEPAVIEMLENLDGKVPLRYFIVIDRDEPTPSRPASSAG